MGLIMWHAGDISTHRFLDALAKRTEQRIGAAQQGWCRLCSMPQGLVDRFAQIRMHRIEIVIEGGIEFRHGGKARRRLQIEDLNVALIIGQAIGARIAIGTQRQFMHRQRGLIARHVRHGLAG